MGLLFAVLLMGLPLAFAVWDFKRASRRNERAADGVRR